VTLAFLSGEPWLLSLLIVPFAVGRFKRQIGFGILATVYVLLLPVLLLVKARGRGRWALLAASLLVALAGNAMRLFQRADVERATKGRLEADTTNLYEQVLDRYSISAEAKDIIGDYMRDIENAYAEHPALLAGVDPCERDIRISLCALYDLSCFSDSLPEVRKGNAASFNARTRSLLHARVDGSCNVDVWRSTCSPKYKAYNASFYATLQLRVAGEGSSKQDTKCAHHAWREAVAADEERVFGPNATSFLLARLPGLLYAHYVEGYRSPEDLSHNDLLKKDFRDWGADWKGRIKDCSPQSNELDLSWVTESATCWYGRAIDIYKTKAWKYGAPNDNAVKDKERWLPDLAIRLYGVRDREGYPQVLSPALRPFIELLQNDPIALMDAIGSPISPSGHLNLAQLGSLAYEQRPADVTEEEITRRASENARGASPFLSLVSAVRSGYDDPKRFFDLRRAKLCGLIASKQFGEASLDVLAASFGEFDRKKAKSSCGLD
jgi:hypothetical protein